MIHLMCPCSPWQDYLTWAARVRQINGGFFVFFLWTVECWCVNHFRGRTVKTTKTGKKTSFSIMGSGVVNLWALLDFSGSNRDPLFLTRHRIQENWKFNINLKSKRQFFWFYSVFHFPKKGSKESKPNRDHPSVCHGILLWRNRKKPLPRGVKQKKFIINR